MDVQITKTLGEAIWRRAQADAEQYERAQSLGKRVRRNVRTVLASAVWSLRDSVCLTAVVVFWLLLGDPLRLQTWVQHLAWGDHPTPARWFQWGVFGLTAVFWVQLFLIRWLHALLRPRSSHDLLCIQMALGHLTTVSDTTSSKGTRS